jgi:hypothetical protein
MLLAGCKCSLGQSVVSFTAACNYTLGHSVVACCCECYDEPVSCTKGGWFLDHMIVGCLRHLTLGWTKYNFLILLQLDPLDVLGPPKHGRRVTILGDTSDSFKMIDLAQWVPSNLYVMWSVTIPFFSRSFNNCINCLLSATNVTVCINPWITEQKTFYFYGTGYILYPSF